jgi:NAD(P)-dependent dehydrogenase (short-subunit alcohol dehydrogenase family)
MRFDGKKVFVTGASRGIGRAIAQAFRDEGAYVIGTRTGASDSDAGSVVCHEWVAADFSDIDSLAACAKSLRAAAPDILVNNAGINKVASFAEIAVEDFQRIQQVNVLAPFVLCQAALSAMQTRSWGRIVNISSIWGKISKEGRASYSASKFAIDGMTAALAAEHAANGILANSVAPGFVDTELTRKVLGDDGVAALISKVPAGRLAQPAEIARMVLWLCSDENSYVSGQNIAIDGGFTRV